MTRWNLSTYYPYIAPVMIVLFAFFLPISHTMKSVFFWLTVLAVLSTPDYRDALKYSVQTPWAWCGLLFFMFIILALLWTNAPLSMGLDLVGKYSKLLFLPILAIVFIHPNVRLWVINSYLAAVLVTCLGSFYKHYFFPEDPHVEKLFYEYNITGFIVAWGAYLALLMVFRHKSPLRFLYLSLFLLSTIQVFFINFGRMGYLVYIVLMALLFIKKLPRKYIFLAMLLYMGGIGLIYNESSTFQLRVHALFNDMRLMNNNEKDTSLGYRVQFHDYAASLWKMHPLLGIGTGGFKYNYSKDQPIPRWGKQLNEPHSQYWMILTEQGMFGLIAFVVFLGGLFFSSLKLKDTQLILWGILIAFSLMCFTETILCFSIVGYLLILMSALSLGEGIEQTVKN